MVKTFEITLKTNGFCDIIDITEKVRQLVVQNETNEGSVLIFIPGATASVTTTEFERGNIKDYKEFMQKIIPDNTYYHHNDTWHDGNGFSHLRASVQKASLCVPFKDKKLILGTWQQIVVIDFDNRKRNRRVVIQINGD